MLFVLLIIYLSVDSDREIVWVPLEFARSRLVLGECYRPPGRDSSIFQRYCLTASKVSYYRYPDSCIMLGKDFNYPGVNRKEGKIETSRSNPVRASNILDIVSGFLIFSSRDSAHQKQCHPTLSFFYLPLVILRHFMLLIKSMIITLFLLKRYFRLNMELQYQK